MAFAIFMLEKELGCFTDEDYPLMKFYSQLDNLKKLRELEMKEQNKSKRGLK